jgi:hypothetical protein
MCPRLGRCVGSRALDESRATSLGVSQRSAERSYAAEVRSPARPLTALLALCAVAAGGCANTLQDQPIAHNILESLLAAPYPVYWLGGSFQGMAITEAAHDPSGAYRVQYGDCLLGGQSTCVPALRVVSSPDNSFIALGSVPHRTARVRGVPAAVSEGGRTIEIATAGVVVSIFASDPRLAGAAAQMVVPINAIGAPGAPLPARLPETSFARTPLPTQMPTQLDALR